MNKKGMTIIEVITSIAILSVLGLTFVISTMGIMRVFSDAESYKLASNAMFAYAEGDNASNKKVKNNMRPISYRIVYEANKIEVNNTLNTLRYTDDTKVNLMNIKGNTTKSSELYTVGAEISRCTKENGKKPKITAWVWGYGNFGDFAVYESKYYRCVYPGQGESLCKKSTPGRSGTTDGIDNRTIWREIKTQYKPYVYYFKGEIVKDGVYYFQRRNDGISTEATLQAAGSNTENDWIFRNSSTSELFQNEKDLVSYTKIATECKIGKTSSYTPQGE